MFQRLAGQLAAAVALVSLLGSAAPEAHSQDTPAKRVLLISTGSRLAPGFIMVDQQILRALGTISSARIETYAENLDVIRFPVERSQLIFNEYLAAKYADNPPDLIILVFVGHVGGTARLLQALFPNTPIVVAGFTEENLPPESFGTYVTGIGQRIDPEGTLQLITRLQPGIRRVVVIGGTAEVDGQVLKRTREAVRNMEERITVDFWDSLSMAEVRQRVTSMPPDTAILFARMFRDGAGHAVISSEVGQWIARNANAPVYILTDTILGTGSVGGSIASAEAFGKRAGELARLILSGSDPSTLPFEVRTNSVPVFDWRALKRWKIDERLLPDGSEVRFKPQSAWTLYRSYILAAIGIMVLQSAFIFALVAQRRKRRRIEGALAESQQFMELATDAGELGLWSRNLRDGSVWVNASLRALFGFGAQQTIRFEDLLDRVHADDRARVLGEVERAQAAGLPFQTEYRMATPDGEERWVLVKGRTMRDTRAGEPRRMGVVLDMTERRRAEQTLRQRDDDFRRLVESTRVVIWQADPETWVFTYVSPYAAKLLGYPVERWYEKDFWVAHIHPEDRDRAIHTCLTLCRQTEDFDFEYRMVNASREVVWIHDIVSCQRLPSGDRITQLRGLMFDITERKKAEHALRESEDRFRVMANAAPVMMWMSGTDKLCTFFNDTWLAFTGRALEEQLGNGWTASVYPDEVPRYLQTYHRAFDDRQEFQAEYRLRRYDGEYRYVFDHGVPHFEPDGTFVGYIGTCIDVTDRKRAEESLEAQRSFLRQVIDVNPNFIFAKDRAGRFTLANQAVADAYGVTVEDLLGRTDADFNPNVREVDFFRRIDLEVMDGSEERFISEERITDAHGRTRWLQTVKRPLIGGDGRADQVLGASTDITLRKQTEIELQKLRAELAHVARISLMGELSASLAHELNQPLTAILTNARAALRFMAHDPPQFDELQDILEDIVEANKRAAEVIRRMRVLVKKEEALEFSTVDLPGLILEVVGLVHSDALMQGVRVTLELEDRLLQVRGDRVQLQQVLLNILLNAFDAMKDCETGQRVVNVRAERCGQDMNRVSITDSGPGLSPEQSEKIFEPFYTTKREGLGMGLSICRSIIEAHGGMLWAENIPQGGAAFFFTVPVQRYDSEPDASTAQS